MVRFVSICLLVIWGAIGATASETQSKQVVDQQLERIIQEFRSTLGISEQVFPSVVEEDPYLVSVRRSKATEEKVFLIQFERKFLSTLTEEDLRAVVAHEMGHVWIFTHHPYLQTEALANQKARILVSQDSLARVYEKVWRRREQKGTLEDFLAKVGQR